MSLRICSFVPTAVNRPFSKAKAWAEGWFLSTVITLPLITNVCAAQAGFEINASKRHSLVIISVSFRSSPRLEIGHSRSHEINNSTIILYSMPITLQILLSSGFGGKCPRHDDATKSEKPPPTVSACQQPEFRRAQAATRAQVVLLKTAGTGSSSGQKRRIQSAASGAARFPS